MNILKTINYRAKQLGNKISDSTKKYRQPVLLPNNSAVAQMLTGKKISTVLLVSGNSIKQAGLYNALVEELNKYKIDVIPFTERKQNPTLLNVENGCKLYLTNACHAIIGFGGGSPIDCAKAIGARVCRPGLSVEDMQGSGKIKKRLPLLVTIPTTAGTGTEVTKTCVITDADTKTKYHIDDINLIPDYTLLDPTLTYSLLPFYTATIGVDALSHSIESFISKTANKKTRELSMQACKLVFENLTKAYQEPTNALARANMLEASYNAGLAFTKTGLGYVRAISHAFGGQYDITHGYANAAVLPNVLNAYGKCVYGKIKKLAVYCNFCEAQTKKQQAYEIFMSKLTELMQSLELSAVIENTNVEHFEDMVNKAYFEAHPNYAVPKLLTKQQLNQIFVESTNTK